MNSWLYAASSAKAGAERTFSLAYRFGIVWRSYYANRHPPIPIPNVKHLRSGDLMFLGYRDGGAVELLGRVRIGSTQYRLRESAVFTEIPEVLVPEFEADYAPDPILGRLIGIVVEEEFPQARKPAHRA